MKTEEQRIEELVEAGATQSDAQAIVEAEQMQVKAPHTPGPWAAYPHANGTMIYQKGHDVQATHLATVYDGTGKEPSMFGNARLIASSPELLTALKDCVTVLGEMVIDLCPNGDPAAKKVADIAIAIIEKAEGEQ